MEVPKSLEDFIKIIQLTPRAIISERDRERIAAVMSFDSRRVIDLMETKDKMVFVGKDEILGPLTLDKLYKSGFKIFPVVDKMEKVIGILNTSTFNDLSVRDAERVEKYMEKNVNYLHASDSLEFAVEEITRTGGNYFLVLDSSEKMMGFFTVEILLNYLIGQKSGII